MQPAELEPVVALWRRSRDEVQPWLEARMGHSREGDRRFFGEVILEQHEVWLAVEGDRAVGFMALSPGFVEHLYVDPPEQGRGVGGALLAFALTRSPRELSLYTHQRNLRARRFYERRGFRAVAFGVSPLPECEPDVLYRWRPSDPSGERGDAPGQQELRAEVERQPPDGIDETG
ncbi:MAG: GNAT family N-acetyltransferase [Deltaproteobacteria bacterium]|jgi:GNAT superfamily N-acetyltransferase|nr:GNAT family N-acetyltransferase [Deltaproteobacteria bacterium]